MRNELHWILLILQVVLLVWCLGFILRSSRGDTRELASQEGQLLADAERRWRDFERDWLRRDSYARAARAVGMWPHRVDRRADLIRHLESLGTAPTIESILVPMPALVRQGDDATDTADSGNVESHATRGGTAGATP